MTDNVVHLVPDCIGDGAELRSDEILTAALGKYHRVVIVGETANGEIEVCGTHGAPESLMLLAWAQSFIVSNRVDR